MLGRKTMRHGEMYMCPKETGFYVSFLTWRLFHRVLILLMRVILALHPDERLEFKTQASFCLSGMALWRREDGVWRQGELEYHIMINVGSTTFMNAIYAGCQSDQ